MNLTAPSKQSQIAKNYVRSGGRVLIDNLLLRGVDTIFCVPGESFLGALDAIYESSNRIQLITCRQEGGAANMAEAYGKLTGKPGICFVTRGPGALNASIAVHTARQDSTPLILFIGQVERSMLGREAFQEVDYRKAFGEITKSVEQVDDPRRLPECVARAFAIALSGRPGPVAVVLPEDTLTELVDAADIPAQVIGAPAPEPGTIERMVAALNAAERPIMVLGGSGWSEAVRVDAARFANAFNLPTVAGFRCQDRMDNTNPNYIGELGTSITPALAARIRESDLLLVVGERMGEMTTSGYELVEAPRPRQQLIHVHAGAEELGKVYFTDIAINSTPGHFFAAVKHLAPGKALRWHKWASDARAAFEQSLKVREFPGALDFDAIMSSVRTHLSPDAVVTNGAGNYTGWPQRHYLFRGYPTQLAPVSGAMGYGVPAVIAAKIVDPVRPAVCFAGDGCFMMSVQELATAVQYELNPIIIVVDNGMYGTIRMHQERRYPDRVIATNLSNPDFKALAESFGGRAETVRETREFEPAFLRALASDRLSVLHLVVDPEVISTRTSLSEMKAQAKEALSGV